MSETRQNPRRQRIDAVINAIKKGEYDDKLNQIRGACDFRNLQLRKAVLEKVKEVYGPDYEVVPKSENRVQKPVFEAPKQPNSTDSEAPLPSESEVSATDPLPETPLEAQMGPEIERRGASIGGIGPGDIA